MSFFLLIVMALAVGDVLWWRWANRRAKSLPRAALVRWLVAAFCAFQFIGYVWIIGGRFIGTRPTASALVLTPIYLWHLIVLPVTGVAIGIAALARFVRTRSKQPIEIRQEGITVSRRNVLAAGAAIALPPLLTGGATFTALRRLDEFRINRMTIPLARLPRELDGMTIAHVSDVHIGRFTQATLLPRLADATNALRADLILLTGDLIDFSMRDLPSGIDFLRKLDPHSGIATVEGNHDLFEDRNGFEQRVAEAVPLLLNDSRMFRVRGRDVQVLGTKWGVGKMRGANYDDHARSTLKQLSRNPAVFPIMLAHHPHVFDLASDAGIPLTLAGHTHGGQLMLTKSLGPGPMMFKYWSGLYRKEDNALVVSNGVGNWFPLRINAPAEIVHITLRCAS